MGDKKARREAREEERRKKARQLQLQHEPQKRPKSLTGPEDREDKHPRWQFNRLDWNHLEWGWCNISSNKWEEVIRKLGNFDGMTWGQIEGSGSHLVEVSDCPNRDTQRRLEELNLDDVDTLFSLRLSGPERVWGILDGNVLKLLWYDPNHTVWPTQRQ